MNTRYFVGTMEAPHIYAATQTGELLGLPVYREIPGDPVLGGRFLYQDGGWQWIGPCPARPRQSGDGGAPRGAADLSGLWDRQPVRRSRVDRDCAGTRRGGTDRPRVPGHGMVWR